MNVADLNQSRKPVSQKFQSAEQAAQAIDTLAEELKEMIFRSAEAGDSFDKVERKVHKSVFQIGQQAMDLLVRLQGDGDLGAKITTAEGKTLRRSDKPVKTTIRSIFGKHTCQQFTYASGPKKKVALKPISARLSLPESQWSYLLQEFTQMLAVDSAYEQATNNLSRILGGKFSVDTAERINGEMGRTAGQFLLDLPDPKPGSEEKLLIATADCKGVPLVKEDSARVAAFETAKKNPGNRRMATATSVYTVAPHVRTAEEITAALFREEVDENEEKNPRPRPQNKNTTAHFPETHAEQDGSAFQISGIHVGMAWIIAQVTARRRKGQVLIALMDGQQSLWETMKMHLDFSARTVPILDILHALSYVWEAAGLFEKEDSRRKAFTRERCLRILRGEVRGVIRGLRKMGTSRGLTGKGAKDLTRICGYLEKNADRMRYDEYLRRGYPIASGVIEGACRHLIKDRMERSGMRWTLEGARSMLNVRAAFQGDHWEAFLNHRMEADLEKSHPHRELVKDYDAPTLAT
jgi:hypothetical protein